MKRNATPVVCAEPLDPLSADEVIAMTLSVIRGRVFGRQSAEVRLLRQMLQNQGFDIYRVSACAKYRLPVA